MACSTRLARWKAAKGTSGRNTSPQKDKRRKPSGKGKKAAKKTGSPNSVVALKEKDRRTKTLVPPCPPLSDRFRRGPPVLDPPASCCPPLCTDEPSSDPTSSPSRKRRSSGGKRASSKGAKKLQKELLCKKTKRDGGNGGNGRNGKSGKRGSGKQYRATKDAYVVHRETLETGRQLPTLSSRQVEDKTAKMLSVQHAVPADLHVFFESCGTSFASPWTNQKPDHWENRICPEVGAAPDSIPFLTTRLASDIPKERRLIDQAVRHRAFVTSYFHDLLEKASTVSQAQQQLMYRWSEGLLSATANEADRAEQTLQILQHILFHDLPIEVRESALFLADTIVHHVWTHLISECRDCQGFYTYVLLTYLAQFSKPDTCQTRIFPFKSNVRPLVWCRVVNWSATHVFIGGVDEAGPAIARVRVNLFCVRVANGIHYIHTEQNLPLLRYKPLCPLDVTVFELQNELLSLNRIVEDEKEAVWRGNLTHSPLSLSYP